MSPEAHPSDIDSEPVADAPTGAGAGPLNDNIVNDDTAALIDDGIDDGSAAGGASLEAVRRERDEYLDMVRRVQADFENYKKRTQRQQTDQLERAAEDLVTRLLPALDALDLARAHLSDEDNASDAVKPLLQATGLIFDALAKDGLERIDEPGAVFDPTVHDAVEHSPAEDGTESGVVADVLRTGYRWKGRVIRPAMVRVRG